MFGVKKRVKKTKDVKTQVQREAAIHAQVLKIQNAVREANRKRLPQPPERIYINGWFYKIIRIDVKKLLKKKKTQKPIEAEFHSPEQHAEIEKAREIEQSLIARNMAISFGCDQLSKDKEN